MFNRILSDCPFNLRCTLGLCQSFPLKSSTAWFCQTVPLEGCTLGCQNVPLIRCAAEFCQNVSQKRCTIEDYVILPRTTEFCQNVSLIKRVTLGICQNVYLKRCAIELCQTVALIRCTIVFCQTVSLNKTRYRPYVPPTDWNLNTL